jgi:hypothetical protein
VSGPTPGERPVLPAELVEALAQIEDGVALWERQCEDMRALHIQWITEPLLASERRGRAEDTAYHLAKGSLAHFVQRPRWYHVVAEIVGTAIPI